MHSLKLIHIAILISLVGVGGLYAQTSDSAKITIYKNTLFSNSFLLPYMQSTLCYGRSLDVKSTLYGGFTYLHEVPVAQNATNYDEYNESYLRNTGFVFGYQYLLSNPLCRVKLYWEPSLNFFGYKWPYGTTSGPRYVFHELVLGMGLSMKVSFLKKFYYYQNIGAFIEEIFVKETGKKTRMHGIDYYPQPINIGFGYNFSPKSVPMPKRKHIFVRNHTPVKNYKNAVFNQSFIFPDGQTALCYSRVIGEKSTVYGGLSYLVGDIVVLHSSTNHYIQKHPNRRYYPYTYNNHIWNNTGFIAGYQHLLSKPHRRVRFYLDGNTNIYGYKVSVTNTVIYRQLAFNLGIAMKVRFFKHFYYYQNIGSGANILFIKNSSNKQRSSVFAPHQQLINAGIGCNF